ncbi:hypothetical protein CC79DRAFT_1373527 [Sarocladium strictum]
MRHHLAAILPKNDESDTIRESSSTSDTRVPSTSEDLTLNKSGNDFKSEFHWTTVLNSATGPIGHEVEPDERKTRDGQSPHMSQTVLLFECGTTPSRQELIAGLPSRKICDGLVTSYFRIFNYNCFVHAGEFLKNYRRFWDAPESTSISWLALLYSAMCLAVQFKSPCLHDSITDQRSEPCCQDLLFELREKTVHCLIRAQYGNGGPFVMETLLHYLTTENYLRPDANTGLWLLLGTIVQIAIRMGYHRDPRHFKSLSPYEGEMRRRVWAHCCIFDVVLATQLGLPTIIKSSTCDTLPPANVSDKDYDATSTSLPPVRPDEEITQCSVTIAKYWLAQALSKVSDALSSLCSYSLDDAMRIDEGLQDAMRRLPDLLQHRSLSESILDSRLIVFQRINIRLAYLRGRILLHWKFAAMLKGSADYDASRRILVDSAVESLELQHLAVDELRTDHYLAPKYLYDSAIVNHTYLLATSVLCFHIRYQSSMVAPEIMDRIRTLLRGTQVIWQRSSKSSAEARRAADALGTVLDGLRDCASAPNATPISQVNRGAFNSFQLPFTFCSTNFDDLPQPFLGDGDAFLYTSAELSMDPWGTFV